MKTNIHIGYGDSATDCIQEAIENYELPGAGAIPSRDDFTQGPISESHAPFGINQRIEYWKSVNQIIDFGIEIESFYNDSMKILDQLEADEITLWVGDSCHDILATGWLISYLGNKKFDWYIVNLAKVDKDDFIQDLPAVNLAMYTPDDLNRLYTYRQPLDAKDEAYFKSKWESASAVNSHYRIQKGSDIVSVNEDYFDEYILSYLSDEYKGTSEIIGLILRDGNHRISDTTIECNIRKMIERSLIEVKGDLKSSRSYSIRKIIA